MNNFSNPLSRRNFLAGASSLGALFAASKFALPLPTQAQPLLDDPRIAKQPIADKGFASVRKIGDGLYATIADRSKGLQARCNGGVLVGGGAAGSFERFAASLQRRVPDRTRRRRHDRRFPNHRRLGVSAGDAALGHAIARTRR